VVILLPFDVQAYSSYHRLAKSQQLWPTQISEGCYAVFEYTHSINKKFIDTSNFSHVWCLALDNCEDGGGGPAEIMVCDCKAMENLRRTLLGMHLENLDAAAAEDVKKMANTCPCNHVRTLAMCFENNLVPKTTHSVTHKQQHQQEEPLRAVLVRDSEPKMFSVPNSEAAITMFHRVSVHFVKGIAFKCKFQGCQNRKTNGMHCHHIADMHDKYIEDLPDDDLKTKLTCQIAEELKRANDQDGVDKKRKRVNEYNTETVRTYLVCFYDTCLDTTIF
jgi:hypothetical protein